MNRNMFHRWLSTEKPRFLLCSFALCALGSALMGCATTQRGQQRELAESADVREQVQAIQGVQWQQLLEDGERATVTGDFTRAEQYLFASLERGGPAETILPKLLRACVNARRYRAAVEYARPFLEAHESAWQLRFLVATIHLGLTEPLTARRHFELVLQYNPRHAEAEFMLGTLCREDLHDPEAADRHFRAYLALDPDGIHADAARSGLLISVRPAQSEPQSPTPVPQTP